MNIGKFKITALLIIAMLIIPSSLISAASYDKSSRKENSPASNMETKRQELYKDLNLSEEQKNLLEENRKSHREEMKSILNQMKEKREAIRNELQKDELNIGRISQINNELKILSAQMLDGKLEGILKVRKILTPEQFKKFMTKIDQRQEHFSQKRD